MLVTLLCGYLHRCIHLCVVPIQNEQQHTRLLMWPGDTIALPVYSSWGHVTSRHRSSSFSKRINRLLWRRFQVNTGFLMRYLSRSLCAVLQEAPRLLISLVESKKKRKSPKTFISLAQCESVSCLPSPHQNPSLSVNPPSVPHSSNLSAPPGTKHKQTDSGTAFQVPTHPVGWEAQQSVPVSWLFPALTKKKNIPLLFTQQTTENLKNLQNVFADNTQDVYFWLFKTL